MRVHRENLLHELESVQPGLSSREIVEQSSCFIFQNGKVLTFNEEIACTRDCGMAAEITGAVQAAPLLALLQKLPEDEIDVTLGSGELLIKGKKRKGGIRMDAEILLSVAAVETPAKWKKLPKDFTDAVSLVQQCAGKDEEKLATTCVHLHPQWIEACDNYQVARYHTEMGIAKECMVRRDAIKHIVGLGMHKFSETDTWLHFKNPMGLVLSCRRFLDAYDDLTGFFDVKGKPVVLSKSIAEAVERSAVFASDNPEDTQIHVQLRPGKLRVKGVGVSGWFSETKAVQYSGAALDFMIPPKLFMELVRSHHECIVSDSMLKVEVGKYAYVTVLSRASDSKTEAQPEEADAC